MSAQGLAGPLDAPAAREAIHTCMDRNETAENPAPPYNRLAHARRRYLCGSSNQMGQSL